MHYAFSRKLFRCIIFIALYAVSSISAHAEKWVGIGEGWYVDTDHKERKGDLARVFVRSPDGRLDFITFDCKTRTAIEPASWNNGKSFSDDSTMGKMFSAACKKWYEVWK